MSGNDGGAGAALGAAAKEWLEARVAKGKIEAVCQDVLRRGPFDFICLSELVVSQSGGGRVLCSFRVPSHLADADGNWQPGAIVTVIDDVGATAIMTNEGIIKISVDFTISFFSPARIGEEVEIHARAVGRKGEKLTAMEVVIRKKGGGGDHDLVAIGWQWMSSTRPHKIISKL